MSEQADDGVIVGTATLANEIDVRRMIRRVVAWAKLIDKDVARQLVPSDAGPGMAICQRCGWTCTADARTLRWSTSGEAARLLRADPTLGLYLASPVGFDECFYFLCSPCQDEMTVGEAHAIGCRLLALVAAGSGEHLRVVQTVV